MAVKRIVRDIATLEVQKTKDFYQHLFELQVVMDQGWIVTLATGEVAPCQISIASEGGSGAVVPDLSIEVDDVDATHSVAQGHVYPIVYPLTDEPWGVRRFFVKDPTGQVINVLMHLPKT